MGLFTRDLKTLEDLFMHGLKDIYDAENQIVKNLPKMIEVVSDAELKKALKAHLVETENQVTRLEQAFELLGENPRGTRRPGIDGILTEGDEVLGDVEGRSVTNAAVVASAQAVEHYEITRTARSSPGRRNSASWMSCRCSSATCAKKAADKKLSAIAEARVNKGTGASSQDGEGGRRAPHGSTQGQQGGSKAAQASKLTASACQLTSFATND